MKKITITILILLVLVAFVYAFFQQTVATKAKMHAEMNAVAAIEARTLADKNTELYREENQKLRDSLKNCKGR